MICIFLASMGWVVYATIHQNDPLAPAKEEMCGSFPQNVTHIKLEKKVFNQWHWEYGVSIGSLAGAVEMSCPTFMHDVNVVFNDKPIGRTNGKVFSVESNINLLDCHNNLLYTVRAGSYLQVLINKNTYHASLQVDKNGATIYYVEKDVWFTDNIDLLNVNHEKVANLQRNKFKAVISMSGWTWDIDVFQPVDPLLLIAIAGEHSFSENAGSKNSQYDSCNQFFHAVWIIMFIFMSIIILCLCYGGYYAYKNGCNVPEVTPGSMSSGRDVVVDM